jgi:hypothetical protein
VWCVFGFCCLIVVDSCSFFLGCCGGNTLYLYYRDPVEIQEIKDEAAAEYLRLNPPPPAEEKAEEAPAEEKEEDGAPAEGAAEGEAAPTEEE